jgi:hypothetical protein
MNTYSGRRSHKSIKTLELEPLSSSKSTKTPIIKEAPKARA